MNAGRCNCTWCKKKAPRTRESGGLSSNGWSNAELRVSRRSSVCTGGSKHAAIIAVAANAGAIMVPLAGDAAADAVVCTGVDRRWVSLADRSEVDARQTNA